MNPYNPDAPYELLPSYYTDHAEQVVEMAKKKAIAESGGNEHVNDHRVWLVTKQPRPPRPQGGG